MPAFIVADRSVSKIEKVKKTKNNQTQIHTS